MLAGRKSGFYKKGGHMDRVRNVELTKDQIIQELLLFLRQNQRKDVAIDIFEMAAYIDGMEKKLDSVLEELTNVKKQLNELQKNEIKASLKEILSEAVSKVGQSCHLMKEKLYETKTEVRNKALDIVVQVKKNGKHMLAKTVEFMGIKSKLEQLKEKVQESLRSVNDTIEKIDAFGNGMRQSFRQAANTLRSFADKEVVDYEAKDKKISKTELVKTPWKVKQKLFYDMDIFLNATIGKVAQFALEERNKDKEEISDNILNEKNKQAISSAMINTDNEYGGDAFEASMAANIIDSQQKATSLVNLKHEGR
jgi:ABC-type transporter Mla subunit MlaD